MNTPDWITKCAQEAAKAVRPRHRPSERAQIIEATIRQHLATAEETKPSTANKILDTVGTAVKTAAEKVKQVIE